MNRAVRLRLTVLLALLLCGAGLVIWTVTDSEGGMRALLDLTHHEIEMPPQYGVFHLLVLLATVLLTVSVGFWAVRITRERLDGIVFAIGIAFLLLELYKQLYYHTALGNGHYNFAVLPFQLCSYSLYLYLLLPLLPEGRVKSALYGFTAVYQTLGGGVVLAIPLFYTQLSLTVHTVVWHLLMVVGGFLILFCRGYGQRYVSELLPPFLIFIGVFSLGMVLNVVLDPYTESSAGALNLFYLSPYGVTNNFLIGDVRNAFGWFPAVLTYIGLITVPGANAVWLIARAVFCAGKRKGRRENGTV